MANLPLAFAEILAGAIILDAGYKGDSITNVVLGKATQHPLLPGGSAGGSSSSAGGTGSYVDPLPQGTTASRVDAGGDYVLPQGGKFLAPADSTIVAVDQRSGFGNYIAAEITDGPLAGTFYYVAEGVRSVVHVGQTVTAGAPIADAISGPYGYGVIEAGWAGSASQGNHDPLAHFQAGYAGDQSQPSLTAGYSFARFIAALHGPMARFESVSSSVVAAVEAAFAQPPAWLPYGAGRG